MAYLRYSADCDWHVFVDRVEGGEECLTVQHRDHNGRGRSYTAGMVRKMLETGDYSAIPGFQPQHKRQLRQAFETWLNEQASEEM